MCKGQFKGIQTAGIIYSKIQAWCMTIRIHHTIHVQWSPETNQGGPRKGSTLHSSECWCGVIISNIIYIYTYTLLFCSYLFSSIAIDFVLILLFVTWMIFLKQIVSSHGTYNVCTVDSKRCSIWKSILGRGALDCFNF